MSEPKLVKRKEPSSRLTPDWARAVRIAAWYALVSAAWIVCSGWLLHRIVREPAWAVALEDVKGWFFVLSTAVLLCWLLGRYFSEISTSTTLLRKSEERLRLVGDNLPGSYVYQYSPDPEGKPRFTYVSAGVEQVHGVKPADVMRDADCLLGLVLPQSRSKLAAAEAASAQTMADFETEVWIERSDGTRLLMHLRSRPRLNDSGIIQWEGIATDVTQRRQAEDSLRERERQLHLFVEHSPAAIAMLDADMRYLIVSRRWISDYRIEAREIIGRSHYEVFPEIPERWRQIHQRCLRGAVEKCDEEIFPRADGSMDWVRWEIRPWHSNGGAIGGLIIFSEVITERKRAEQTLQRSEQSYREIFNAANDAIFLHDAATGQVLDANEAMLRMHGYATKEEFQSGNLDRLLGADPPYNWAGAQSRIQRAVEEGPQVFEWQNYRKNGERFWVEVSLRSSQIGGQECVLAVVRDISERKRGEEALRHSEENFRAMFQMASVGMAQADPQTGQWLRVNEKMCEITGYSAAELLRMKVPDITHPEDRELDWECFQRVVRGERRDYRMEKRYLCKDGSIAWVNVNVTILRDSDGQPLRTMATIEDITPRKKAEEESVRLATALEQAAESILITDSAGTILYVNPAFESISGYSRQEAIGQNPRFLKGGTHDGAFYEQLWATLRRGEVWHGRLVNKRKDGSMYQEDATISPVRDASGKVVNFVAIKLDVTHQVELEAQFRQAQKMEAIGQLAGGVAHDFNNILAAMMMQTDLSAMAEKVPDEVREGLREIRAAADRAAGLTRQLLLFSRRQVIRLRDLDLNEVVTNLAKMLQRMIGEDVRMQLHLHPATLFTRADAGMLDQVLMNLAVNARDAMPGGGRLVIETAAKEVNEDFARMYPEAAAGRYVWLSVTDTGSGIPPEVLPRIFEPFFTTKEAGKGTGLGLATVFGIVKQHRGWIKVYSEVGQGTNFQIFLPATKETVEAPAPEATRLKARGGMETILLAEDDPSVRLLTRVCLERHGYTVLEASNGDEASKLWLECRPKTALLLTDLVMPGGTSGYQLARRLKADNPELKVIYTSGYSAELAGHELELHAGENFLQKPFPPSELLESVRRCLDGAGR